MEKDGTLTLIVINKIPGDASTAITLDVCGFKMAGTAQEWQLTAKNEITQLADLQIVTKIAVNCAECQHHAFCAAAGEVDVFRQMRAELRLTLL